jgi:hypothetical protein
MSRKKSNNVNCRATILNCRATILNAIHQDNLAIKCIPDKFKNDREIIYQALLHNKCNDVNNENWKKVLNVLIKIHQRSGIDRFNQDNFVGSINYFGKAVTCNEYSWQYVGEDIKKKFNNSSHFLIKMMDMKLRQKDVELENKVETLKNKMEEENKQKFDLIFEQLDQLKSQLHQKNVELEEKNKILKKILTTL